jgi:deazaflavin-dependent oxidoreductase (nitroreductase family)
MSPWLLRLSGSPLPLYRHGWGWMLGHRALQLTHRGRRTGRLRRTILEVMRFDPATGEATVMSGSGPTAHWLRNIQANGQLEVSIGRTFFAGTYRLLAPEEAMWVLAEYERRNVLVRPVVHAVLGQLGGGRFDGSGAACRRLAYQLPMVALRPLVRVDAGAPGGRSALRAP